MNPIPSVKELRKAGNKIRIQHFRYIGHAGGEGLIVGNCYPEKTIRANNNGTGAMYMSPRGGVTVMEFTPVGGNPIETKAFCCNSDNFNRKVGVLKCLARALGHQKHQERRLKAHEKNLA
jgi:hypothetical protein